jgi:hypothetical protein
MIFAGKIRFVPVGCPKNVSSGGFIEYSNNICSFDQVAAWSIGCLVFSVLPVLPKELSPPQVKNTRVVCMEYSYAISEFFFSFGYKCCSIR